MADRRTTKAQLLEELTRLQQRVADLENQADAARPAATLPPDCFDALFQTMSQGVVYHDASGAITLANPAAERILGLSLVQLQGRTAHDARWRAVRVDGSDFPGDEHPAMVALRTGKPVKQVVMGVYHAAQAEMRWILIDAEPEFRAGEVQPHRVYTTFIDITEQRQAEAALLANQENMLALLENTDASIWSIDTQYRMLVGNRLYHRNVSASIGRALTRGESVLSLNLPPAAIDEWRGYYDRALRGETFSVETTTRFAEHPQTIEYHFNPIKTTSGQVVGVTVLGRNITERKRAEAQHAILADRLELATRSAQLGIWDWDIQNNVLVWDDRMYKLYGRSPGEFSGAYEAWLAGIHPDDRAASDEVSARARAGEIDYDTEFRVVWPDGSIHWLKANGEVFRDEHGTPLRMIGVNYDITARKQAEFANVFQASLLDQVHNAVIVIDFNNTIVYWNQHAQDLYQYTRDEAVGQNIIDLLSPAELKPVVHRNFAALNRDGHWEGEFDVKRKDGSTIPAHITNTYWKDVHGHNVGFIGISEDVTERQRAEKALRDSEARYRLIAENASDVIWVMDPVSNQFTYVSPSVTKLRGYTPDEVLAQPASEALTPESRRLVQESLAANLPEFIAQGRGTRSFVTEVDQPCKDGPIVNTEVTTTYVFNDRGQIEVIGVSRDITRRKQAEQALRESQELFQALFNSSLVAYTLVNATDYRLVDMNPACEHLFGYPKQDFLGTLRVALNFFADPAQYAESVDQFARDGKLLGFEFAYKTKSGGAGWAMAYSHLLEQGGTNYILSEFVDITDHKRAEQALRRSADIFTNIAWGIVVGLPDGKLLDLMNPAFARMHGYSEQELINTPITNVFAPEYRAELPEHIRLIHTLGHHAFESKHLRRDGSVFPVLVDGVAVKDEAGQPLYRIISVQDITERKRAEEALQETLAKLEKLVEILPVGISVLDHQQQMVKQNAALEKILSISAEGLARGDYRARRYIHPDGTPMLPAEFASMRVQRGEASVSDVETGVVKEDGQVVWTNVSATTFPFSDWSMVIVTTDITARKHAEDELRRSNAELEQFAYVASHDLQEPLRTVAGMVQLIEQRYQGQLDAQGNEYIHYAVDAATRMRTLINDLLAFSRLGTRGKPFEPTDVNALVAMVLADLRATIDDNQAVITQAALPTVKADASQLAQLFQNLIGNALKFRGDQPPHIHISVEELPNEWRFAVRDNGIGIKAEYFERIFVVFQRLHTRRVYPGTGIGLALCKKIVERHGGKIWVESTFGEGATFYFTVPK